jgi:hypothetical protein
VTERASLEKALDEIEPESSAFADVTRLDNIDLVPNADLGSLEKRIREINL